MYTIIYYLIAYLVPMYVQCVVLKMELKLKCLLFFLSLLVIIQGQLLYYHDMPKTGYSVTYDNRSFILDGKRTLLLSGAVHYPRIMEGEWETVFNEMIKDGLNMVQTYIFWNLHEPVRGDPYDFTGNKNFLQFVEQAGKAGLFVTLRIGPFVAAEWDYGGIPHWINDIPDMVVRSTNEAWQKEMSRFFKDIVSLSKPYLADNGGPIILSQVENEFRFQDPEYVNWCGKLVTEVNVSIPFYMCNGYSANNTLSSLNGNDGAPYAGSQLTKYPKQPLSWTENEGWFQEWEVAPFSPTYDNRTASDMAFVVAKWFARGAAHHNYYMWYGGNNYGRYAAGSCITNMYAAGTNILFDGHYNEPKKSHLQHLHETIAKYSSDLLKYPPQVFDNKTVYVFNTTSEKFVPATQQYAFVYGTSNSGLAFIENVQSSTVTVMYENHQYNITSYSVLLIDLNTKEVVYDTVNINSQNILSNQVFETGNVKLDWKKWEEPVLTDSSMAYSVYDYPVEQLYITNDLTDYLFYETTVSNFEGTNVPLIVNSRVANSFVVYVDGVFQSRTDQCGKHYDSGNKTYVLSVNIPNLKEHHITLLSISLGVGTLTHPGYYSLRGITGSVLMRSKDITEGKWIHRKYLQGELKQIYTVDGTSKVNWTDATTSRPPVWYKTSFDRPTIKPGYTLLLDMKGMGRGYFFVNGMNMGRYWLNMVGGKYVQRYYYIPESVLTEKGNLLVLVEDMVSDPPDSVELVLSTMTTN